MTLGLYNSGVSFLNLYSLFVPTKWKTAMTVINVHNIILNGQILVIPWIMLNKLNVGKLIKLLFGAFYYHHVTSQIPVKNYTHTRFSSYRQLNNQKK